MKSIFAKSDDFLSGMVGLLMAILPVTILFQVLTGSTVFGMDVIENLTAMVNGIGNSGFAGLVVLMIVWSFFTKK